MATQTEELVQAFAHCRNPLCPGEAQQPVDGIKRITAYSYVERGGDLPFTESTTEHIVFADEAKDGPCPHCSLMREVTNQVRPTYEPMTGFSQRGLLSAPKFGEGPYQMPAPVDDRTVELEAKNAELEKRLNDLAAKFEEKDAA
jgi:hypothetical protein